MTRQSSVLGVSSDAVSYRNKWINILQAILVTGDCRVHYASIAWCFSRAVFINVNGSYTAEISEYDLKVYFAESIF